MKAGQILMKPVKKNDSHSTSISADESPDLAELLRLRHAKVDRSIELTNGYDDTVRWSVRRTAALVITTCLAFWVAFGALLVHFLS